MASVAAAAAALPLSPHLCKPKPKRKPLTVSCGPRDNRGPLVRGRTLSTEAILAVQSLKRSHRDPTKLASTLTKTLTRLLKPDLIAALRELLRQDHAHLALHVLALARREPWYKTDYGLYAEIVSALARNKMSAEIDDLVSELVEEGFVGGDDKGVERLVKAVIAAGRAKAVVDLYGMMKIGGWGFDEYVVGALCRGLRRLGEMRAADEVEGDFRVFEEGGIQKLES